MPSTSFRDSAVRLSLESYAFLDEEADVEAAGVASQADPNVRSDGKELAQIRGLARAPDNSFDIDTAIKKPVMDRKQQLDQQRKFRRKCTRRLGLFLYILAVALGCASFQIFGCFCLQAHGDCGGGFQVGQQLGVGWCCAVGGGVTVHMYASVPIALYLRRMYSAKLALRIMVEGAAVGAGLALVLARGLEGMDPPPGFGLSGVPAGSATVAREKLWLHAPLRG